MSRSARYINVGLGVWLVISGFLWPHSESQFTNSWLTGVLCAAFALIALRAYGARYLNTVLGVWLVLSSFLLPRISAATFWNHLLVGLAIALFSLIDERQTRAVPTRPAVA